MRRRFISSTLPGAPKEARYLSRFLMENRRTTLSLAASLFLKALHGLKREAGPSDPAGALK